MVPVVVVADLFMALMLSRPEGVSLRSAWVTPGTLMLTLVCTPAAVLLAVLLLVRGGVWGTVCAVLLLVFGAGSAAVAAVALSQRRARA
jgi:hypothetical protein